jgi:hypothetical protein
LRKGTESNRSNNANLLNIESTMTLKMLPMQEVITMGMVLISATANKKIRQTSSYPLMGTQTNSTKVSSCYVKKNNGY